MQKKPGKSQSVDDVSVCRYESEENLGQVLGFRGHAAESSI
jgi:hypothetical protein